MAGYKLSDNINTEKVFIVNRSELEDRFDPKFIEPNRLKFYRRIKKSKNIVKLKEVIKEGSYGVLPPGDSYHDDNPIKFIRATELKENLNIDFEDVHYVEEKYYTKRASIKKNDILLAVKGATIASNKCVAYVSRDVDRCIINGSIFRIQVKDKAVPLYIAHLLNSDLLKKQMKYNLVANNAVDYLDKSLINNLLIPLPSINEQNSIVKEFEEAYSQKQQKEAEAQALLDSIDGYLLGELGITLPVQDNSLEKRIFRVGYSEIVRRSDPLYYNSDLSFFAKGTYTAKRIKDVVVDLKSGIGAGKQDQALDGNGVIQLRPTNIDSNGQLKFDKNVYLPFDVVNADELLELEDVLFNNTNSQELVGKTAILTTKMNLSFSNHITRIRVNTSVVSPYYLQIILNSYQKHRVFYSICTNWNNQSGVGIDLLKSVNIPVPPLERQIEIANHIQSLCNKAKQLQAAGQATFENAKQEVERMILG